VKCLGVVCPNTELPKDLQTKQNQTQVKREILENIEKQEIRKMRPEQEILKNREYAEIRKIRGQQTKMHKTRITHRSRQKKRKSESCEYTTTLNTLQLTG